MTDVIQRLYKVIDDAISFKGKAKRAYEAIVDTDPGKREIEIMINLGYGHKLNQAEREIGHHIIYLLQNGYEIKIEQKKMTIYVDDLFYWPMQDWRKGEWCHMMSDDSQELDDFARKIGLKPSWRHGDHYDLRASKRFLAVKHGAVEVDAMFLVGIRKLIHATRQIGSEND